MDLASASDAVIEIMPEIQQLTDKAIRDLTRSGASVQQVFVAGRQLVLSDRILRHLAEMLRGGQGAVAAADSFAQEIESFRQTSDALLQGDRSTGVARIGIASARDALNRASLIFENARPEHLYLLWPFEPPLHMPPVYKQLQQERFRSHRSAHLASPGFTRGS